MTTMLCTKLCGSKGQSTYHNQSQWAYLNYKDIGKEWETKIETNKHITSFKWRIDEDKFHFYLVLKFKFILPLLSGIKLCLTSTAINDTLPLHQSIKQTSTRLCHNLRWKRKWKLQNLLNISLFLQVCSNLWKLCSSKSRVCYFFAYFVFILVISIFLDSKVASFVDISSVK